MGTLDPSYCGAAKSSDSTYAPRMGLPVLRQLLGHRYGVPPDQVVVLAGASMALTCCFMAAPADRPVLLPRPGFPAYSEALRLLGREACYFDLGPDWMGSVTSALQQQKAGTLVLNSPGNPIGNVISDAERQRAIELAADQNAKVILDETYAGLEFPGSGSSGAMLGECAGLVRIGSFSKRFAMPGLRVGYAIAESSTASRIANINWILAMSPGGSSQITAAQLMMQELKDPASAAKAPGALQEACQLAIAELSRHGITATRPHGGPLLWITMADAPGTGADLAAYCEKESHILASPGEAFGHLGPPAIRCCYALPLDQVGPVFDRLGAALASYGKKSVGCGKSVAQST